MSCIQGCQSSCLCQAHEPESRAPGPSAQVRDCHTAFNAEAAVHINLLRSVAKQLTGSESDADDLLQETLLRAYSAFDSYRPGTNCKAWLFRIMRNSFCNMYRKRTRRPTHVSLNAVEGILRSKRRPPIPISDDLSVNPAVIELMDDDVRRAIDRVGPVFRATLMLCDVHGLTYREAAEVMSCSIGTVRSRLSRARSMMRKCLQHTDAAKRMAGLSAASARMHAQHAQTTT